MSQTLYTESCEAATITLTNAPEPPSNKVLLTQRDLRIKGLDVAAGSTTITIEIDFGVATTVDYILMGALNVFNGDVAQILTYYWTGAAWSAETTEDDYSGLSNLLITFGSQRNATKYKIEITRTVSNEEVELACIFLGAVYTFPEPYLYQNNRTGFQRTELMTDAYGYPYGQAINTATCEKWETIFHLTKTQLANLRTQMEYVDYNLKPFFIKDTNIDTTLRLVKYTLGNQLTATNLSYEYFEIPFNLDELK